MSYFSQKVQTLKHTFLAAKITMMPVMVLTKILIKPLITPPDAKWNPWETVTTL